MLSLGYGSSLIKESGLRGIGSTKARGYSTDAARPGPCLASTCSATQPGDSICASSAPPPPRLNCVWIFRATLPKTIDVFHASSQKLVLTSPNASYASSARRAFRAARCSAGSSPICRACAGATARFAPSAGVYAPLAFPAVNGFSMTVLHGRVAASRPGLTRSGPGSASS